MWVEVARLVRGQVMILKEAQYVEAAQSFGYSTMRIIFKHLLPNILGPVMVIAAANFATAILLEAGLSYLGFGIRPPTPSWGTMLNETYGYAISGKPILAMIPAFAIMLLVLAFNLLGNGIRDALDVKSKIS
jgi:peptide/nickel transport system permease protein